MGHLLKLTVLDLSVGVNLGEAIISGLFTPGLLGEEVVDLVDDRSLLGLHEVLTGAGLAEHLTHACAARLINLTEPVEGLLAGLCVQVVEHNARFRLEFGKECFAL